MSKRSLLIQSMRAILGVNTHLMTSNEKQRQPKKSTRRCCGGRGWVVDKLWNLPWLNAQGARASAPVRLLLHAGLRSPGWRRCGELRALGFFYIRSCRYGTHSAMTFGHKKTSIIYCTHVSQIGKKNTRTTRPSHTQNGLQVHLNRTSKSSPSN